MNHVIKSVEHFSELLDQAIQGKYAAQATLKEAYTTDDLPNFLRGVVNAELEAQYAEAAQVWREFASQKDLQDFRPAAVYELLADSSMLHRENGGQTMPGGLPHIPELTPYPTFEFVEGSRFIKVGKHGARTHFSFESFINDEWDQIADLPSELVRLALDTEDILATAQLVGSGGINAYNFNAGNDNVLRAATGVAGDVTGPAGDTPANAPLSLDALFAAIKQIGEQTHNGRPVQVNDLILLVPAGLEVYANVLVNAVMVKQTIGGVEYEFSNPLPKRLRVVVNPWLTAINESASAATTWFILPSGGKTANGRRTVVETFLRGRNTPEMRVSGNTGRYVGGGDVPSTEGSFDNDDAEVRLRHIVGSGFLNPGGTIVSTGTGTA